MSVVNNGGGTESQTYNSGCTFGWELDDGAGGWLGGGPDCTAALMDVDYVCGEAPVVQSTILYDVNQNTGSQLASGDYWLSVDTFFYGSSSTMVTVP